MVCFALFFCAWLSLRVQLIVWKDSSPNQSYHLSSEMLNSTHSSAFHFLISSHLIALSYIVSMIVVCCFSSRCFVVFFIAVYYIVLCHTLYSVAGCFEWRHLLSSLILSP